MTIPDECPIFAHSVYGYVEILPIVSHDPSVGSGLSVQFYVPAEGAACDHEWSTLDVHWIVTEDTDWRPVTSAAREVAAAICEQTAMELCARASVDRAKAREILRRARGMR